MCQCFDVTEDAAVGGSFSVNTENNVNVVKYRANDNLLHLASRVSVRHYEHKSVMCALPWLQTIHL